MNLYAIFAFSAVNSIFAFSAVKFGFSAVNSSACLSSPCGGLSRALLLPAAGAEETLAIEIDISREDRTTALVARLARRLRYRLHAVALVIEIDARERLRSDKAQIHNARDPQTRSQIQNSIRGATYARFRGTNTAPKHLINTMRPLHVSERVQ